MTDRIEIFWGFARQFSFEHCHDCPFHYSERDHGTACTAPIHPKSGEVPEIDRYQRSVPPGCPLRTGGVSVKLS